MNLVVLCDFDGTVVDIDTSVFILERFAGAEWKVFDEQFERGEISLEECLQRQFSSVRVSEARILKEIENIPTVRAGFERLIEYCRSQRIPLILASAGLDFVIKHFLELKGWSGLVDVHVPKARSTRHGIEFTFPKLFDKASVNFKDDLVRYYKKQGKKAIYVGDGSADYPAARDADVSFAIEGSKLAEFLKRKGIPHKEISDFREVIEAIKLSSSPRE